MTLDQSKRVTLKDRDCPDWVREQIDAHSPQLVSLEQLLVERKGKAMW
ncbi:hypothetical protein [Microbacterium resistens]|uniref:Uncharacterized protein n=1 Tax=Microbacterium resistens TaxID=156977 RepID=A0ABY3RV22_9MICO|nr:hypothetical protein [Microbacterium resistens]UGS26561.1 hypothetical protein K8F61_18405 [Microbacterium resistens]